MKTIVNLISIVILIMAFSACKPTCDPIVVETCGEEEIPNSENCGMSVVTHYSEDGYVAKIYDTRYNSKAPVGADWSPTMPTFQPSNWTKKDIGQVFGLAIDKDENVYLAASDVYSDYGWSSTNPFPGQIYIGKKASSWTATPLVNLPNTGGLLNGIGNIAYDQWNNQLFATNLEDGKIYRIELPSLTITTFDPWMPYTPSLGMVSLGEQVWGVGVNKEGDDVKVYFPRIFNGRREIYSVTLDASGAFPTGVNPEVVEITGVPGIQEKITDLAFSTDNNEMLVSERGDPHQALDMSYTRTSTGWIYNKRYYVGAYVNIGENSAGGVDFAYIEKDGNRTDACDEMFWATGNYMKVGVNLIYGMEGINYSGNQQTGGLLGNDKTDLFVDFDGVYGNVLPYGKGTIGDVEVFDCTECKDPCSLNDFPKK